MLQAVSSTRARVSAAGASQPGPSSTTPNARQRRQRHPRTLPVLLPPQHTPPGDTQAPGSTLLLVPITPPPQQQQQQQADTRSVEAAPTPAAPADGKPAWALAVDRRVAALPCTSARSARWRGRGAPGSPRSAGRLPTSSSLDRFLEGGELSAEGEQQLCLAYQVCLLLPELCVPATTASTAPKQSEHLRPTHPAC